jgi:hypothetical protein
MRLILELYSRQAWQCGFKSNQSEAECFVQANKIKALTNIRALGELQLSVSMLFAHQHVICTSANATWRTAGTVQAFMECAETMATFFAWYQFYTDLE